MNAQGRPTSGVGIGSVVVRSRRHADCKIEGESVLMSFEREEFYALNATASEIWRLTDEPTTVAAIVEDLMRRYRVDGDTCAREVCELVDLLVRCGLVDPGLPAPGSPPM